MSINIPRDIYQIGRVSFLYYLFSLLGFGLIFIFFTLFLLDKTVLSRLACLNAEVKKIRESGDFSARVLMKGKDELSNLAMVINHLLVTVQRSQDELEQRVVERTKELIKSNKDLKHQINERKQTEEALRESEEKFHLILNQVPAILWTTDRDLKVTSSYGAFLADLLDVDTKDLIGKELSKYLGMLDSPPKMTKPQRRAMAGESVNFELGWMGHTLDIHVEPLRDSRETIVGTIGIALDLTERKKVERALRQSEERLRFLSTQLLNAQENERRRISRELHDELGQALMVLKLQIRSIQKKLPVEQDVLKSEFDGTINYINELTENVRRLSRDLSPAILEDLGLSAALSWLLDEVSKHHHIEISTEIEKVQHQFSKKDEIAIFRVLQEALTNIWKHSRATHVSIGMKEQEHEISFTIVDNGKGFDPKKILNKGSAERGLGLTAMDERVRMMGGCLDIWSREGEGAKILFTIPKHERGG